MAYLTIMKQCLANECATCPGHENTPPKAERPEDQILGGGICVHSCHGAVSPALEESVRKGIEGA